MKKLFIIVIVSILLFTSVFNYCLTTEEIISNESIEQIIKNRALINYKSVGMCQSSNNQDCEYMYGFNAYPGPEEIIRFRLDDPSEYETVCPELSGNLIIGGGTYGCDDIWYVSGDFGLYGIDLLSCEQWLIWGGRTGLLDIAYDPINFKIYGSSDNNYLFEIDPYTGEQEQIGPFGGGVSYMISMAFDEDGVLYGIDLGQDCLWTINTETGEATQVGSLGININYAQSMDFCRETDVLYIAAYTSTGQLYECDEDTGQCTLIGAIGSGIEVVGAIIINNCTWDPRPPKAPIISGPDNGVINQEYNFTVVTTDPNWDNIFYFIDWGDNTSTGWIGPYVSGENVTINHSWSEKGIYEIKAKAKDIYNLTSEWSDIFLIDILGKAEIKISTMNGGLFNVNAQIENTGDLEAKNVNWKITLEGGALIGKETTGVVNISAGENITITSNFILGFGPTILTVTADIPESSVTENRGGFVLLIYIHVNIGG